MKKHGHRRGASKSYSDYVKDNRIGALSMWPGGEILDKPKQFIGTSVVVKTERSSREVVEESFNAGFEPHFAVIRGDYREPLAAPARMLGMEVCNFRSSKASRASTFASDRH